MTTASTQSVSQELHQLLHPADTRDIPTPGFPTHDALVAWARSKPTEAAIDAALDVLRTDTWPQQYAAMALLRSLGVEAEGEGYGQDFRWRVRQPGQSRRAIDPAIKDPLGSGAERSPDLARHVGNPGRILAEAIGALGERQRVVLSLLYYERLTALEIAVTLGISESDVRDVQRTALHEIRRRLTSDYLTALQQQLVPTATDGPEPGDLALLRELVAA